MNDLQEKLFELLCEFDDICRKNDISYYLSGGTLLGALRHEGFIPWDDDVDVNMTYSEYKKLEEVIDGELREDRRLISKDRNEEYCSPVPRYVRLDSSLIRRNHLSDGTPHGVYLDILILDPMPSDEDKANAWKKKHYVYCELLEHQYIIAARKRDWRYIDVELFREYQARCESEGRENVLKELENELFSVDMDDAEYYCMRFGTVWLGITSVEWYGKGRKALFEGREFPIPIKAEMELYAFYGLGWKYIPKEKAEHKTMKLTGIESGNFEREFFKNISKEKFNEILFKYNDIAIDKYKLKIDTYFDKHGPYISYITYKIDKQLEKYSKNELLDNIDIGLQIFKDYMALQFSYEFLSNGYYIHLNENVTCMLAELLLKNDDIQELADILTLRQGAEGKLSEELQEKLSVAQDLIAMSNLLNLKEFDRANEIMARYRQKFPDNQILIKAELEIELAFASSISDYNAILGKVNIVLKKNPSDSELMKHKADALEKCGCEKEAKALRNEVMKNIDNGIMLLELSKKINKNMYSFEN